jgi:hypothetical protein
VLNSLTKLKCPICQIGLSDFGSSNSAMSFIKFQNRLFTPSPLGDINGLSVILDDLASIWKALAIVRRRYGLW